MRKLFTILIIFLVGFHLGSKYETKKGTDNSDQYPTLSLKSVSIAKSTQAEKVANLERVFLAYNSPLATQSAYLVGLANRYNLDYRLIPGIAFTESTLCKFYPAGTFNCFGWGSARIRFSSFEEAEETITKKLATHPYYNSWRQNQNNIGKLSQTYNGADTQKWTKTVIGFMEEIENANN